MTKRIKILETTEPTTIYLSGMFGYRAVECRKLRVEVGPWAQYPAAYFVSYVEKGKRSERGTTLSRDPKGLIVAGHGHPGAPDPMKDTGDGASMSRYSSCSPEWDADFQAFVAAKLTSARVLLDITHVSPEAALASLAVAS